MHHTFEAVASGAQPVPSADARAWGRILREYSEPCTRRAAIELTITALPFLALLATMWAAVHFGQVWLCLLLAVPAAGFLVRLFMIQHDCGHGAFFPDRQANRWLGRILGPLTLTPFDHWSRTHAMHHASHGDLDRRGTGDIDTLTVREYLALSRWGRLRYRLYRHPAVMFGLGPVYVYGFSNRLPLGWMRAGWRPWASTLGTNVAIAAMAAASIWLIGLWPFLTIYLPVVFLAGAMGIWLFYVQHQFEETHWARTPIWNASDSALRGSSYYDLPQALRWLTANIGVHHVHHLSSRVPFYRLGEVLRDHPHLAEINRMTLRESFRCVPLVLWDEATKRLVSFRELRKGAPDRFAAAA